MAIKYVGKKPSLTKDDHDPWTDHLSDIDTSEGLPPPSKQNNAGKVVGTTGISKKKASESSPFVDKQGQEEIMQTGLIPLHKLAHVHVTGSQTLNLGNYESAKVTVGVTFPCNVDEIDTAYEFSSDWVSGKLTEVMAAIKSEQK